jgi:hypothetical protein
MTTRLILSRNSHSVIFPGYISGVNFWGKSAGSRSLRLEKSHPESGILFAESILMIFFGQISRMVPPRSGLRLMSRLVWAVAPGLIERSVHLAPWFLLVNYVCFDRFSSCSLPFAGTMSFLIGAIGGWPPPSEYHMVERQVNNVTGGGAVGVPAQQV